MRWLVNWWRARQRAIDVKILWPICCEEAGSHEKAKEVFAIHAIMDPAWLALGSADAIIERIEALPWPAR